jgi:hypothetical protein
MVNSRFPAFAATAGTSRSTTQAAANEHQPETSDIR